MLQNCKTAFAIDPLRCAGAVPKPDEPHDLDTIPEIRAKKLDSHFGVRQASILEGCPAISVFCGSDISGFG